LDGNNNPSKYAATITPAHFAAMLGRPGKDCDFDAIPKKCAKTRVLERPVLQSRRRSASLPAPKMGLLRPRARLGASTVIIKKTARATVMRTKGIFMAIFDE